MAEFNPQVQPIQDPQWWHWQERGIERPQPDKTKSTAITSASRVGDAVLEGADFVEKKNIDNQIHASVDKEREQVISALKSADPTYDTSKPNQPSLLNRPDGSKPKNLPPTLQNLSQNLETLGNAVSNKLVSPTYYEGKVHSILQDASAQHPGYQDYVRDVGEKWSGDRQANR